MFEILKQKHSNKDSNYLENTLDKYNLKKSLDKNINMFKDYIFKDDDSIIFRTFSNEKTNDKFCLIYVDGMVNNETINECIMIQIMNADLNQTSCSTLEYIKEKVVAINEVTVTDNVKDITQKVLYGDVLLLIDKEKRGLILNSKGFPTRNITEPQSETILRGPKEGFTESILMNISLVRRKINNPALKFKFRNIGARTNTKICISYVDGIVNKEILNELEKRLQKIDVDGVFAINKIGELIEDSYLSPYRTIGITERPDVVASKLIQGRIAIFCDGTPAVLTLPFLFIEYFQVNEDYYEHFMYASINRILRILSFFLTISTPAIYVAIITFHKEMIPVKLVMSIYLSREGVPFSSIMESFIMLFIFEIIREAGVRLPKNIGSAVSIVGALVLGQAAVDARFISAPMVIVIAITGLSSFMIPEMMGATFITRIVFLISSSIIGIYGYFFSVIGLIIHLMSLKSFGVPYMNNIINLNISRMQDTPIRMPWRKMKYRTKIIAKDKKRYKKR